MIRGKRILVLTPRFPYPVIGGDRLRIHAICQALSREYELTLLSLCERKADFDPQLVSDQVFSNIERVYLPRWRSLLQTALAVPGRTPLQVAYYRSPEFAERVEALLPKHDLSLAHLIRTGHYLRGRMNPPNVLEMTDAISMNYARVRSYAAGGTRGLVYAIEQSRLAAYERDTPRHFHTVSLIAEGDAKHLWSSQIPSNVVISSNGVDRNAFATKPRQSHRRIAVFIGNMHSAQNFDACRHFVEAILPMLSAADLEEFRVVGRIRESDARWLRTHDRVTATGEVASVPEAVADAWIGVCPVRIGAGVQNKVLEYMALGLPVVCSPVGHEGIGALEHQDLLVAATPQDFTSAIRTLGRDSDLYERLTLNGRRFIEHHHSWQSALAPLIDRIRGILATSNQTPTPLSAPSEAR